MYNLHDTICAISTPPGESALAIVRLTGDQSKTIAEKIIAEKQLRNRQTVFCKMIDEQGDIVDEVIAIWYEAPKSFTAEDMVEIICHGGYVVSQQILLLLCKSGARLAEPGEFTLRAFLNGRLDLTRAEAVNSVIYAKSSKAKQLAINNLEGRLNSRLTVISNSLFELIAILEAEIDFGDEEATKLSRQQIESRIKSLNELVDETISTYDIGRISEGRAQVAIVGAPNVGKSSLFNALLKSDRAIVTSKPGTTRDYLSEYIDIGGYPVILTDTAGIRDSDETVEIIGIDKTKGLIDNVDLCLFVLDVSRAFNDEDKHILDIISNRSYIPVINKIDIDSMQKSTYSNLFAQGNQLRISAITGYGIEDLVIRLRETLIDRLPEPQDGVLLSQRQFGCAQKASGCFDNTLKALNDGETEEIIVSLLREAQNYIGELTGKITSDDILNSIFSRFCIGK